VSVQVLCETYHHENMQLGLIRNSSKHESHQNDLIFKAYVCHVQTKVYIHIQNITSPQMYMHEGTWLKDVYVYLIV